jgi:chromosome segregation ATPase
MFATISQGIFSSDSGYLLVALLIVGTAVVATVATYLIMKNKVALAESSSIAAWAEMNKANQEKNQALREKVNKDNELAQTKQSLKTLQTSLSNMRTEDETMKVKLAEKSSKIENLVKIASDDSERIRTLIGERDSLGGEVSRLKEELNHQEKEKELLQGELQALKNDLKELKKKHGLEKEEWGDQKSSLLEQLRRATYAFESQKNVNEKMAIDKEKEIQAVKSRIETTKTNLEINLKAEVETLRGELENCRNETSQWEHVTEEQEKKLKQLQADLELVMSQKETAELNQIWREEESLISLAQVLFFKDYFGRAAQEAMKQWDGHGFDSTKLKEKFKEAARLILNKKQPPTVESQDRDFKRL